MLHFVIEPGIRITIDGSSTRWIPQKRRSASKSKRTSRSVIRHNNGFILLLSFLAGCAFLPLESAAVPHFSSRSGPALQLPYREAVGVIHVHSVYSDGEGTVEEIARAARRQGLDFVLLTDHNTLRAKREGQEKQFGSVWLLVGNEISTASGHYLALKTDQDFSARQPVEQTIQGVRSAGGLGFLPHPYWPKSPWRAPEARGFVGMEIYNAAEAAKSHRFAIIPALSTLFLGLDAAVLSWLERPKETLALWDRYLAEGPMVGIGGADAHGLSWMGFRLGPYGPLFKLVRNHLWVKGSVTPDSIYEALEQGRLFVAHDAVADARGFLFFAQRGGAAVAWMGEQIPWQPDLRLYAYLPAPGEMVLYRDGKETTMAAGQQARFDAPAPGVYRLEARRRGRPWIYSNPIYVLK